MQILVGRPNDPIHLKFGVKTHQANPQKFGVKLVPTNQGHLGNPILSSLIAIASQSSHLRRRRPRTTRPHRSRVTKRTSGSARRRRHSSPHAATTPGVDESQRPPPARSFLLKTSPPRPVPHKPSSTPRSQPR